MCRCRAVLLSGRGRIEKSIFGAGGLPDTPLHCACLFCSQPLSTNTPDSQALRVGGKEGRKEPVLVSMQAVGTHGLTGGKWKPFQVAL